jgi:hypothetical protein
MVNIRFKAVYKVGNVGLDFINKAFDESRFMLRFRLFRLLRPIRSRSLSSRLQVNIPIIVNFSHLFYLSEVVGVRLKVLSARDF